MIFISTSIAPASVPGQRIFIQYFIPYSRGDISTRNFSCVVPSIFRLPFSCSPGAVDFLQGWNHLGFTVIAFVGLVHLYATSVDIYQLRYVHPLGDIWTRTLIFY